MVSWRKIPAQKQTNMGKTITAHEFCEKLFDHPPCTLLQDRTPSIDYARRMGISCSIYDLFAAGIVREELCRIVYKDTLGEHHAVIAIPRDRRILDDIEWGFFASEAGESLEVRLDDVVAIEALSG